MFGAQPGRIVDVRLVDIHGAKFYDVAFALETAPQQVRTSRLGQESVYADPQPGDLVALHLVLGQLTRIEKRAA